MKMFRKSSFFDTVEPFFNCFKVGGCAGFQLRSKEFQNTVLDLTFCLVNFSIGFYNLYVTIKPRLFISSLVLSISWQIVFYLIVFSCLLVFLINFLNRRTFHQLLKQFHAFDIEVSVMLVNFKKL